MSYVQKFFVVAIVLVMTVTSFLAFDQSDSPDLRALWTAAEYFHAGQYDQIYPDDTEVFTLTPPHLWLTEAESQKTFGPLYPYIYPPIWAALLSELTNLTSFQILSLIAGVINPVLLGLTVFLAWRASQSGIRPEIYMLWGMGLLFSTVGGQVALDQNQPHILVSFLIVLAAERSLNKGPILAGAALALAAAIKLFPVLFAFFWLARKQWSALISFALVGAGLGLMSIAVAGWGLHSTFLTQIGLISQTVLLSGMTNSLDAVIGLALPIEWFTAIQPVENLPPGAISEGDWYVLAKPWLWQALSGGALIAALAALARLAASLHQQRDLANVWVLAMMLFGLLNAISWSYYYIPALVFFPAVVAQLASPRVASLVVAVLICPNLVPAVVHVQNALDSSQPFIIVGTATMALYAGLVGRLLSIARRPRQDPTRN